MGCLARIGKLLLFLYPLIAISDETANKFWQSFRLTGNYSSFLYNIEPQIRWIDNSKPFNQFLLNAGGGYPLNSNWEAWFGQTIGTTSQDADPGDLEEYRIWEQILAHQKWSEIEFVSRTRLEQRKSLDFPQWANRIREQITLTFPMTNNLSLVLNNELFVNLNQVDWIDTKTWDQNRAYVGVMQKLSASQFLNVGYMHQWVFSNPVQSDNVFLLNYHIHLKT